MDDKRDGRDDQLNDEPGMALHMKLGGAGDPVEPDYSAQAPADRDLPDQAAEDIDTGVALHMKLGGAGEPVRSDYNTEDDAGSEGTSSIEGSRLCPGCNTITQFSKGTCPECGFQFSAATSAPPAFASAPGIDAPASGQVMKIVMVVVLVGVLAFAISRIDFSSMSGGGSEDTTVAADIEEPFIAVKLDEEFHLSLSETISSAMEAWTLTGVDAYIYRYRAEDTVEPGVSQHIRVTAYVGGQDAAAAIVSPGDKPIRNAMSSYLAAYGERTGLQYDLILSDQGLVDEVSEHDHYVRWGYHYGSEHQDLIDQVTKAIEDYRTREGEYPHTLASVTANMKLDHRGFSFIPGGWGYLPIFETDSAGNVPFGSGSSSAELYPRKISGYYLVRYLSDPDKGVDLLSDEGKTYYLNRISPLPCIQKGKLQNVPMEPDGEPDGIAWAVKNGKLLDV